MNGSPAGGTGGADGKVDAAVQTGPLPTHSYCVAYVMNEFPGKDTIYIGDGGDVVTISAQAVRPRNPGKGSGVLSGGGEQVLDPSCTAGALQRASEAVQKHVYPQSSLSG